MSHLFEFLFFFSVILLIIGLIKPSLVLIKNKTKKKTLVIYGTLIILFGALVKVTYGSSVAAQVKKMDQPVNATISIHVSNNIGLGDSKKWVEDHLGKPSRAHTKHSNWVYDHNKIQVAYKNGLVTYYKITFSYDKGKTLSEGKKIAKKMMPRDAKFIKSYNRTVNGEKQIINVYKSDKIKMLWLPDVFLNAKGKIQPGYFDVVYSTKVQATKNQLISVSVFAGDNP